MVFLKNRATMMAPLVRRILVLAGLLVGFTAPASAQDDTTQTSFGYKVDAQSAAGVSLSRPNPTGARRGVFILIARDAAACMAAFPDSGVWADLCVAAQARSGNRIRAQFIARPEKGTLVQTAALKADVAGFPFELTMMLNSEGDILSVSAGEIDGVLAPAAFTDEKARFEAMRTMGADETKVTALLRGNGFSSRLDVGAVQPNGQRSVSMNFFFNAGAGRDCLMELNQVGNTGGWVRICDKADKDGLLELGGILQPINGGAAHAGTISAEDGSVDYRLVISQVRNGFALVGLRAMDEPAFTTANVPENVVHDDLVPGQPLPPSPSDQTAAMTGYRVFGNAGMAFEAAPFTAPATSKTRFVIISKNATDCLALAANVTVLERVCEKMDKEGIERLEFSGDLQQAAGRELTGGVDLPTHDLRLDLRARIQGTKVATLGIRGAGRAGTFLMVGEKAMFDRLASNVAPPSGSSVDEIVGYRLGAFTVAEMRLAPEPNGQSLGVRFKLDAKVDQYGFDRAVDDCYPTLSQTDLSWGRQCEKATKDNQTIEMSGTLTPVSWRRDAFAGTISIPGQGWTYQMLVVNPGQRIFEVALSRAEDANFQQDYTLLKFDTMARPLGTGAPVGIAALVGDWRLPQEKLSDIGFDLEMSLAQVGGAMTGKAIAWFRAETDQISGFCPSTTAMLRICERIQKDGPLEFELTLGERLPDAANAWRGTATPVGFNAGPFDIDFFQGSSIADWGDQDADAHYLRFRTPTTPPGSEAVAWLKLEKIDRSIVTTGELATRGTLDRPPAIAPPAPPVQNPQSAQSCDLLTELMRGIGGAGLQQATELLSNAGFWGGILPQDPEGCARAMSVLAAAGFGGGNGATTQPAAKAASEIGPNGWPLPGSALYSDTIDGGGNSIEFTTRADGVPIIRSPQISSCRSARGPVCDALISNPGEHVVFAVAGGDDLTLGLVNIGGGLFLARIDLLGDGARRAYLMEINMQNTMGLGLLRASAN